MPLEVSVSDKGFRVVRDPTYEYRRLEPLPSDEELRGFYQSQYYHLIRKGGRAPELRRLMAGGQEADRERSWLRSTLYADISHVLGELAPGKRVLDVGCGTGELVGFLVENGFAAEGIEPSADAVAIAKDRGRPVRNLALEEFVSEGSETAGFDAVVLINVLEHVPDPAQVIELCKAILKPEGVICARVPNDFSEIQLAAQKQVGKREWWVVVPDHINYFDFASLEALFKRLGFGVVYAQGDFPMELLLLMGFDYVGDPEMGSQCHRRRCRFEAGIPADLRRRIYRSLAGAGVGRNCLTFARLDAR